MRKSKETLEMAGVMIPKSEKARLQGIAKKRGMTLTELLLTGGRMLADFNEEFLAQVDAVAFSTKLNTPQVLTQLLLVYAAQDSATLAVYGKSTTYQRAFQFDNQGALVTGSRLSNKVYAEVLQASKDLKKRLQDSARGVTETTFISNQDAAQMAIQMTREPIRAEA